MPDPTGGNGREMISRIVPKFTKCSGSGDTPVPKELPEPFMYSIPEICCTVGFDSGKGRPAHATNIDPSHTDTLEVTCK